MNYLPAERKYFIKQGFQDFLINQMLKYTFLTRKTKSLEISQLFLEKKN